MSQTTSRVDPDDKKMIMMWQVLEISIKSQKFRFYTCISFVRMQFESLTQRINKLRPKKPNTMNL